MYFIQINYESHQTYFIKIIQSQIIAFYRGGCEILDTTTTTTTTSTTTTLVTETAVTEQEEVEETLVPDGARRIRTYDL